MLFYVNLYYHGNINVMQLFSLFLYCCVSLKGSLRAPLIITNVSVNLIVFLLFLSSVYVLFIKVAYSDFHSISKAQLWKIVVEV